MTYFGRKAIDCLRFASMKIGSPERDSFEDQIDAKYSAKATWRKLEELADRGYVDYGVSARGSWLTDKGKEALKNAEEG